MGSSGNSAVDAAMQKVKGAENHLMAMKANRDTAKKNGNYKNASKNYNFNGKVGNVYDNNVWVAERALKEAKQYLAEVKKRK